MLLFVQKRKSGQQAAAFQQMDDEIELRDQAPSERSIGHAYTNPLAIKVVADQRYDEVDAAEFKGIVFGKQVGESVLDNTLVVLVQMENPCPPPFS